MANAQNDEVSAGLAGFDAEPDWYPRERWASIDRQYLAIAEPLHKIVGPKLICDAIDVSRGQLSREFSASYGNRPSLIGALCLGAATQNERIAQLIVCDGLGMRMPEWQRRKITVEDELRALRAEVREKLGSVGEEIVQAGTKRARS